MDTQDKESLSYKIPAFGQLVVGVLFNPERWDGELVSLGTGNLPSAEVQATYKERGLYFVATFGFINGRFCSAFEHPLENNAVEFLARAYAEYVYATLTAKAAHAPVASDAVDWLKSLWILKDDRDGSKEN